MTSQRLIVTGGAGYTGSHTVIELLDAGHEVVIIDNLDNACREAVARVEEITGRMVPLYVVDLCDQAATRAVFQAHDCDAVIHFAGLKAVGESVTQPLRYYRNNLLGTMNLLQIMQEVGCKRLVFSSSATVYGDPERVPLTEDCAIQATNPYGQTKLMIEQILCDQCVADPDWQVALLRYFNPVGAHASGRIGEDPDGIPNNLVPYIAQVAVGRLPELQVFGDDYPTPDGTGVRDYIHVVDLAHGHLAAVDALADLVGCRPFNLGTGQGYSVLEMVRAFESASGQVIPYRVVGRRPGDIATCYADPSLAQRELGWRAELDLRRMCADTWRWQQQNPQGYGPDAGSAAAS